MNAPRPGFSLVDEEPHVQPQQPPPQAAQQQRAANQMLIIALTALAQRTVVALASLFTLVTVGSAFFLWWIVLRNSIEPTDRQLAGLAAYSAFVLLINLIVRRK